MNNYKQIIHKYVQAHRNEIVQELSELVKIPSVRGEAAPKAPFGEQCAEALKHTLDIEKEGISFHLIPYRFILRLQKSVFLQKKMLQKR